MKRALTLTLPWLLILVFGAFAAMLRYGLVESPDVAHTCETSQVLACQLRHWTVLGFIKGQVFGYQMGIYGWVALAATAFALVWKRPLAAWLAATAGLMALTLYCFAPGALALLVGCLRLVRLQSGSATPPLDQHSTGGREIHAQP